MTNQQPDTIQGLGLSWIRTGVPILWGYLLTFLATRFPGLHDVLATPEVLAAVVGAVALAWYGLMRRLEQQLPPWLTRLVIGANRAPVYPALTAQAAPPDQPSLFEPHKPVQG